MLRRIFLLLTLVAFFHCRAKAEIFVVTSNADIGPGTLREALTKAAANGVAEKDYINFNLPDLSEAGRTIILSSQLPDVTGYVVIDASSQLGTTFGVSGARICLSYITDRDTPLSGLSIRDVSDVEVYGLYLTKANDNVNSKGDLLNFTLGFEIVNSTNIILGAAGKGNVCDRFYFPIMTNFMETGNSTINLTLKANIMGVAPDGKTLSIKWEQESTLFETYGNVVIGGTPNEGNVFATGLSLWGGNEYAAAPRGDLVIKNNHIGVDHDATTSFEQGLNVGTSSLTPANSIRIEDNVAGATGGFGAIWVSNSTSKLIMLRNFIGTDKTRTHKFDVIQGIMVAGYYGSVQIGSDDPGDANVVGYCKPLFLVNDLNVHFNKNSFFCVKDASPIYLASLYTPLTTISISNITASSISGNATPNAAVELFYADKCGTCAPETYFASVTADNAGNWHYEGAITGTVIASATFNGSTSEFTTATIDVTSVKVISACNGKGSITGVVPANVQSFKWVDEQGNTVGNERDLIDVKPGKYQMIASNGDCVASTPYYEIVEGFEVSATPPAVKKPTCGESNGTVTGIKLTNNTGTSIIISWKDASNKEWGTGVDLTGIPAGSYTMYATSAEGCIKTYGPVIVIDENAPTIDQTQVILTDATCDNYDGSIKGLTAKGTDLRYSWANTNGKTFGGGSIDLENVPAGTYILTVKSGACTAVSEPITIQSANGVSITGTANVQSERCEGNNGSITGLEANGATKVEWRNAGGTLVGSSIDLKNIAAGDYFLTISNATCTYSTEFQVAKLQPILFPDFPASYVKSCAAFPTGSITLNTGNSPSQPINYRWVNSKGDNVGFDKTVQFLAKGDYKLYLTDQNGCENLYKSYTVEEYSPMVVTTFGTITNIQCGVGTGRVSSTIVTGGSGHYEYQWLDSNGNAISGQNQSSIDNVPVGDYKLRITDGGCNLAELPYSIIDVSATPPAPVANNVQLSGAGRGQITIKDPFPTAIYRLYDSQSSTQFIDEQIGGNFDIQVSEGRSYYVSLTYGYCESARTKVLVSLCITAKDIATAFTPNGDGINDYWMIKGLEFNNAATVQIFNRYGDKVFQSRGYSKPFDGTLSGKQLPSGTYYYVINTGTSCGQFSGNVTVIR